MTKIENISSKYGWPLKIHARGYDAILSGLQPLNPGEKPVPIYRFPGGESLVDENEWKPFVTKNTEQI